MATDSRKDDDKDRHMPVHNGGGDTLRRIEVITGTGRRRRWDAGTKARIVAESFEPGCAVSEVARRHDISPARCFGCHLFDAAGGRSNPGPRSDASSTAN
jgi:transposase